MDEKELKQLYESEKEMYLQWGEYVASVVCDELEKRGFNNCEFLKIFPIKPRVKDTNSFIEKALYRNKNYKDPYNDITDKVGIRFIVLTIKDIETIKNIIESIDNWDISCDRDFEKEKNEKPELFIYQSIHYIVRNKYEIKIDKVTIKENTPCEIQVRTLLQHAYAELSHDIIYKKNQSIKPIIRRGFAKSMALIETTDDIFMEVKEMVIDMNKDFNDFISITKPFVIMSYYVEKLNKYVYEEYQPLLKTNNINLLDIKKFIEEREYLQNKVKNNTHRLINTQPIAYLIYYLVSNYPNQALEYNPLTESEILPFFTDLGKRIV